MCIILAVTVKSSCLWNKSTHFQLGSIAGL